MNQKISNGLAFTIYAWMSFFLFIFMMVCLLIFSLSVIKGYKGLIPHPMGLILSPLILAMIFRVFDSIIKPAYFEADLSYEQICFKSFNPNTKNGTRFFLMLFFRKYLQVHTIDRHSYNNYRILIERFGFKKSLILQKIENGKLYESKPINISLLGLQKYTDLILSIDRLKEKISLN